MDIYSQFLIFMRRFRQCPYILVLDKDGVIQYRLNVRCQMTLNREMTGVKIFEDEKDVILLGGREGDDTFSSMLKYDTEYKTWEVMTNMGTPRESAEVVRTKDAIYALSGYNDGMFLRSIEMYDREDKTWIPISYPVPDGKGCRIIASIGVKNTLYVFTGYWLDDTLILLKRFCNQSNTWITMASPQIETSDFSICSDTNSLYLVETEKIIKYNPFTNEWNPFSSLSCPRDKAGLLVILDCFLLVVGGEYKRKYITTSEAVKLPGFSKFLQQNIPLPKDLCNVIGDYYSTEKLIPPMNFGRVKPILQYKNGHILALGGDFSSDRIYPNTTAEIFSFVTGQWKQIRLPKSDYFTAAQ